MTFSFLLQGITVGFSIAAPTEVIGLLCIQNTLTDGIRLWLAS